MAFCKITLVGNLGRDPELRYTPNGRPVCSLSVAVNQGRKNQQTGEWSDETDWFRVSVWGDRAERAAEQLRKGAKVLVDGRFRSRAYETNDGRKGTSLDVTAETVVSLHRSEESAEGRFRADAEDHGYTTPAESADLDELPF
jgi:single-strand DNA-binding protein